MPSWPGRRFIKGLAALDVTGGGGDDPKDELKKLVRVGAISDFGAGNG